jgi:hypothetical protein
MFSNILNNKKMNYKFLFLASLLIASSCYATSTVRSVAIFAANATKGRLIGSAAVANSMCTALKPAICIGNAVAMVGRSNLNVSTNTLNGTVPVITAVNNYTMCDNFADCFVLKAGPFFIKIGLSMLGSVGANQTYWTGVNDLGNFVEDNAACGGNWTVNTTGNVGVTYVQDGRWLNYSREACENARPYLCKCESYATPNNFVPNGPDTVGLGVGIGVGIGVPFLIVVGALLYPPTRSMILRC